jgi:hypothetical protein
VNEADIPADSQPPINARQGLLFEWWSVFWTLFTAKNSGTGSDEALIYTQVGFFDLCYAFRFSDQADLPTHFYSTKHSKRLFAPRIATSPSSQLTD